MPRRVVVAKTLVGILAGLCLAGPMVALGAETGPAVQPTPAAGSPAAKVLTLSVQESILLALKNNLDIAIENFNPRIRETDVVSAEAVFDPSAFAEIRASRTRAPLTPGGLDEVLERTQDTRSQDANIGLRQKLPTGANYEVRFNNNRTNNSVARAFSTAAGVIPPINPAFSSSAPQITLTQPLLKNFGVDVNRIQIRIARNNRAVSREALRQRMDQVIASVQTAYWGLVFARENLGVQEEARRVARDLVTLNEARVRAGVGAPVEITQAKAEEAARASDVIAAEKALHDAEDQLRVVMNLPQAGDWTSPILPADPPSSEPVQVNLQEAVSQAIQKRPELVTAKTDITNKKLNLQLAKNQLLPDLSLQGTLALQGLDTTYGADIRRVGSGDFYSYTAGLVLTIPIGNRVAKAAYLNARLQEDQAETSLRNIELQITSQVREAVRRIEADLKRIDATRAARTLAEEQLRVERKRLEAGVSTTYQVVQLERDLATARANEIKALTDYNSDLANLERVKGTASEGYHLEM